MPEREHDVETTTATDHATAFSAFYREFVASLVAFLVVKGARAADAAEVAQDTMREIYRRWAEIDNPRAYARVTAARAWGRRMASIEEDPVGEIPESTPLLRSRCAIEEWEQRQDLLRRLARLPLRQRQVVAWTLDGYEPREIAAMLMIEPGAVRSSLSKARRTLAAQVEEEPS